MRYSLAALLVLALTVPASASLQLVLTGNYILESSIPDDNDFKSKLESFDLSQIVMGDVLITLAGKLTFYAHASESGFTNSFSMGTGPTVSVTENSDIDPWEDDDDVSFFGELTVAANTLFSTLDAIFTTSNQVDGDNAPIKNQGFGIFTKVDGDGNTILSYDELFFGYDDNGAGPDDNHDDLIVRVVFTPATLSGGPGTVPEPISGIVWGLLAAVAMVVPGVARRR